jgi:hypothetical protein
MTDDSSPQRTGGIDFRDGAHITGPVVGRDMRFSVHLDRPIELHGSRVQPRNDMFVGREKTLSELADRLSGDHALVILTGCGGLGKTQTAIELAHRYQDRFPGGVFWLSCAQPDLIGSEIAACGSAGRLTLPGYDELPQPDKVSLVLGQWQQPIARLLIFDNAEEADILKQWRPATGGCRVLVTARNAEWPRTLTPHIHALPTLERADSLSLLAFGRDDFPHDEAAHRLAERVGDLPLALHVAGAYMNHYGLTAQEYLAECEQQPSLLQHEALQDWLRDELPTAHTPNVIKTFEVSYRHLLHSTLAF